MASLVLPKHVLFHGYLNLHLYHGTLSMNLGKGISPGLMHYETLPTDLKQRVEQSVDIFRIDDIHSKLGHLSEKLKSNIREHAWISGAGNYWHVWKLMKFYKIQSAEIFETLASSQPFGMGVMDHTKSKQINLQEEFHAMTSQDCPSSSLYLDYWNGIGFKLQMPIDMNSASEEVLEYGVEVRRYNDRNFPGFAHRIGNLLRKHENDPISEETPKTFLHNCAIV